MKEKDVKNNWNISKLSANSCPEAIAISENGKNANREYLRNEINLFSKGNHTHVTTYLP
jgi:hypothetical protein